MTIVLERSTPQQIKTLIAEALRCGCGDAALKQALISDHIRSALFAHASTAVPLNAFPALHTTRLLTAARKAADLVWPGTALEAGKDGLHDSAGSALDALSSLGDIVDTGSGFWIGSPLRLVPCGSQFLVLGGSPNAVVRAVTGAVPSCAGASRFVEIRSSAAAALQHIITPIDIWLGSSERIGDWTRRVLAQHQGYLAEGKEVTARQLEVFAPDLLTRSLRNPWIPCGSIASEVGGIRLCRPLESKALAWDRPHFLAKLSFASGELSVLSYVKIDPILRNRLRLGLSSLMSASPIVSASVRGERIELDLPRGLPMPEGRIAALGWPVSSDQRRWEFDRRALPVLSEVLARLDIKISER